jgi:hypothetical protein
MRVSLIIACAAAPLLSGCIARTAVDVVTAPVRAASQVVDWTTTSQDEADRARGREIRRQEEAMGRTARQLERAERRCRDGDEGACADADRLRGELDRLRNPE